MRYISSKEIESLGISPVECVKWVRESFLMKKDSVLPPKISIKPQGTDFINTMPCLLPNQYHLYGCKVVSRIKGSKQALKSEIMLIDSLTGEMIAVLNADWITSMRTGAVATLAINTLQNLNSQIYSFIGLGVIGHSTLKCFIEANLDKSVIIRLKRYKDHAEKTADLFKSYSNVSFEFADTMEELVDNADVIVSCITDATGLLVDDLSLFKPGVLVMPVHTRGFQNCDKVFEKVFADDEGHVNGFKYFNDFRKFGEISDVLSGVIPGRENNNERILSYNIGLGLHDVYFAHKILNLLDKNA